MTTARTSRIILLLIILLTVINLAAVFTVYYKVRQTETAVPLPFPLSNCQTPLSQPPASGAATTAVHGRGRTAG